MKKTDAKRILRDPYRPFPLSMLSFVNLTDFELEILILRYFRGHTQEKVAESKEYSVNGIQKVESEALRKCCEAWDHLAVTKKYLKDSAQK